MGMYSNEDGANSSHHCIVSLKESSENLVGNEEDEDVRVAIVFVVFEEASLSRTRCDQEKRCNTDRKAQDGFCAKVDTNQTRKKASSHDMMIVEDE